MNIVSALNLREQGKRICTDYSIALRRLKCHDYDEFRGISPSTDGPDFNPEPPVFACTFCTTPKSEHLLALANEDGKIAIQDINLRSDHNPFEGHQAHRNAIFDIAWAPGDMRLVSASGDHTAILWDVQETGNLQEVARFHAHTMSVKTVAFPQEDKMMFATGARDGVIMLWDTRVQRNQLAIRPDNFIFNSHSAPATPGNSSGSRSRKAKPVPSKTSSITGLVFQDSHSLVSCSAGDGKIKVWDIRKSYSTYRRDPQPKYSMSTPNESGRSGFTCLALDPGRLKLYASCMDNTIYCYNISTYEKQPVGMFKGHKNGTFYVKACLSPDGNYLLSGSSDEHAYIWDTRNLQEEVNLPIVKLVGHGAEVTSVAWCPVGEVKIVTCSDDARHCLWRIGKEFRGDNHQVELHGWAEDFSDANDANARQAPSTPATPATPGFTSWRRWTPSLQRTPDNAIGQPSAPCSQCHRLSTPCLRCIAVRAPLPASVPNGSKKRLEVLWEEDNSCPECERESRPILNQVTNNLDAPGRGARRLFSPTRIQTPDEVGTANKEQNPSKKQRIDQSRSPKRECATDPSTSSNEPSPKKLCAPLDNVALRRTSPRKRCHPTEVLSLPKRFKVNENASCSRDNNEQMLSSDKEQMMQESLGCEVLVCRSPKKVDNMSSGEDRNCLPGTISSPRKLLGTPAKRRISERRTDSPHKRFLPNDDLQGISKIDDTHVRQKVLCARHSKMGFNSPTLNLPNYVLDGTSPHHRCSPVHHHKENVDWLTRLRRERNSTDKKQESDSAVDQDVLLQPSSSKKVSSQTTPGKPAPIKVTPAKASSSRITPAKASSSRVTPAKASSSRTTPAKSSSRRTTPAKPTQTTPVSQSGRKTPSRRASNSDASSSASSSSGAASSVLRFFRVSEKPIEQQCSLGNNPSKPIASLIS